jgi:DNA-binding transcriptional ArsR family regulator
MRETFADLETLFLALSDKTRLRLLSLMANGPVAVGFLADTLGESQPKVSRHLAYLRRAGLVSPRRDGKWIYYGISEPDDPAAGRVLQTVIEALSPVHAATLPARFAEPVPRIDDVVEPEVISVQTYERWEAGDQPDEDAPLNRPFEQELDVFLL